VGETVLRGALVVDGTRAPARSVDVRVRDGMIAELGFVPAKLTPEMLDATLRNRLLPRSGTPAGAAATAASSRIILRIRRTS